jgi:CheY-like chemotaxis protein
MSQQVVIVDDASDRTPLVAQALRDNGYGVLTVQAQSCEELYARLCQLQPDILVIGDEIVIDLKADDCSHMLREIGILAN